MRCILGKSGKEAKQRFPSLFPETFRMPLDGEQGQVGMEQSFYHIVSGAAGAAKPFPQMVHRLVMGGIDQCTVAVELIKKVAAVQGAVIDIVQLIPADPFMMVGGLDVLYDITAEMHIDDLKALADSQHRLFLCYKEGEGLELQDIQLRIDSVGAVIRLAEKGGRDITAAGKDEVCG